MDNTDDTLPTPDPIDAHIAAGHALIDRHLDRAAPRGEHATVMVAVRNALHALLSHLMTDPYAKHDDPEPAVTNIEPLPENHPLVQPVGGEKIVAGLKEAVEHAKGEPTEVVEVPVPTPPRPVPAPQVDPFVDDAG
jgi:hypothetical protein